MNVRSRSLWLVIALALVMALAACGGDNSDDESPPPPSPTIEANADTDADTVTDTDAAPGVTIPSPGLSLAPDLALGGGDDSKSDEHSLAGRLPGCSDGEGEDCPSPVNLPLDSEASNDGITVSYLSRYFALAEDTPDDVAIRIVPNERFPFADMQATFDVYRAELVESAISVIEATDSGAWTSAQDWEGTIAVQKDDTQDPQTNTSIGAFALPDGGAIVLRAETTGQYGWDLWSVIYENMLNSLVVEAPDAAAN